MTSLAHRESEFLLYQTEDGCTRVEVRFGQIEQATMRHPGDDA